jgi:transposase-like protein
MGAITMTHTTKMPKIDIVNVKEFYNTKIKCPYCSGEQVIHKGAKRDQCRSCKRTFPAQGIVRKRQYFPKIPGFGG